MVALLLEDDVVDIELFEKVEQQYGRLTSEEIAQPAETVGEVAAMFGSIAPEGLEKVMPRKRRSRPWLGYVWWLLLLLWVFWLLWLVGCGIVKLVRWIIA